jgi:hemerythrin-like domain-containing protein
MADALRSQGRTVWRAAGADNRAATSDGPGSAGDGPCGRAVTRAFGRAITLQPDGLRGPRRHPVCSHGARPSARETPMDAIELLIQDHKNVQELFDRYEKLADNEAPAEEREALAAIICGELTIHTRIEEEIFYPAVEDVVGEDLIKEAVVEHASAKDLISQLADMKADDELYDAKVKVLGEQIEHHVEEEHTEMFPKVRGKVDLELIGERLLARKEQLTAELGLSQAV